MGKSKKLKLVEVKANEKVEETIDKTSGMHVENENEATVREKYSKPERKAQGKDQKTDEDKAEVQESLPVSDDMGVALENDNDIGKQETSIQKLSSVQLALQQLRPKQATNSKAGSKHPNNNKESKNVKKLKSLKSRDEIGDDAKASDSDSDDDHETSRSKQTSQDETVLAISATSHSIVPLSERFTEWKIDSRIANCLSTEFGFKHLFAFQEFAIQSVIQEQDRDVCISAPTGSGKTIMYAVPLVHSLVNRIVTRCRGLVLVPSRDLARQVHSVVDALCSAVGLKCCVLAGEAAFNKEADMLVGHQGNGKYYSKVDVLIATPGRLLDHVDNTAGFTLQHLQCLIVDEADRMLGQAYNDWLDRVYKAVFDAQPESQVKLTLDEVSIPSQVTLRTNPTKSMCVLDWLHQDAKRLRRILCSATLTGNPQKLAALALWKPVLVDSASMAAKSSSSTNVANVQAHVEQRLPKGLIERGYRVTQSTKPMGLLYVINNLFQQQVKAEPLKRVLIFVSSVERAARLHSLLSFAFGNKSALLLSSDLSRQERTEALERFKSRKAQILVASDLAARGLDVPGLEYVISYDAPRHEVTYVHRAGRTARAGQEGTSIVLLRREEFAQFNGIKRKLKSPALNVENISNEDITKSAEQFQAWKDSKGGVAGNALTEEEV